MVLGNANGIDLNNDSLYRISKVGGLGVTLATRIVRYRPLRRWSDLKKIEGFDAELIENLRGSGAILGRPQTSARSTPPPRTTRPRPTPHRRAQVGPPRKSAKRPARRRAKNIFSGEGNALE
jgi:hypothetical protein